jgi:hypothetical protein
VSLALWSLAELQLPHGELALALTTTARRHLDALQADEVVHILASLAQLGMRDRWLADALATLLLNLLHQGHSLRPALAVSALCALAHVRTLACPYVLCALAHMRTLACPICALRTRAQHGAARCSLGRNWLRQPCTQAHFNAALP